MTKTMLTSKWIVQRKVDWIKDILEETRAKGVILGLSGGVDSALVAALCKLVTPNVLGILMPCGISAAKDREDALALAKEFNMETLEIDLTKSFDYIVDAVKAELKKSPSNLSELSPMAKANIKPRLRMTTLYAIGQTKGYLVAGTGNASEIHMGYFTKWGDSACDFNPIADLTKTDVYQVAKFLNIPEAIITKAPSAGLWQGQTDEAEMGVSYKAIDTYIKEGAVSVLSGEARIIERAHSLTNHKRNLPLGFP